MFRIIKRTAMTMDGQTKLLAIVGKREGWAQAMIEAMQLEADHRGQLHNGRAIMFEVETV